MDLNVDLFDDRPATSNAPVGGRFKPKAKPLPKKGTSLSFPSTLPSVPKEKIDTLASTSSGSAKLKQDVHVVPSISGDPGVKFLTTSESNRTKEPLRTKTVSGVLSKNENIHSELVSSTPQVVANSENLGCADVEGARLDGNGDLHSGLGKPAAESFNMLPKPTADNGNAWVHGMDQPPAKVNSEKETSALAAYVPPHNLKKQLMIPSSTDSDLAPSDKLVGVTDSRLIDSVVSSSTDNRNSDVLNPTSQLVANKEDFSPTKAQHLEASGSDGNGHWPSIFGKPTGEEDSSAFDSAALGDNLLNPGTANARTGGKFKPKARLQPIKKASALVTSPLPCDKKENLVTLDSTSPSAILKATQTVHTVDAVNSRQGSVTEVSSSDRISSEPENVLSQPTESGVDMGSTGPLHLGTAISDCSGYWKSNFGKSTGENADIFFGLECLHDFLSQSTAPIASAAREPQPEVDENAQPGKKFPTSFPVTPDAELSKPLSDVSTLTASSFKVMAEETGIPVASSVSNPTFLVDDGSLETEAVEAFPSLDNLEIISDSAVASGHSIGKFLPKPKVQCEKGNFVTHIPPPDAVVSHSCLQDSQSVPPDCENVDGSTSSAFLPDNVLDFSSVRFGDPVPTDPASGLPFNEELTNPVETSFSDVTIPELNVDIGAVSGVNGDLNAKRRRRKCSLGSDLNEKARQFSTVYEDKSGESSRQLRKRVAACKLVNETEDNTPEGSDFLAENPYSSVRDEGDDNDDEYRVEITSRKRQAPRKSKKPVVENEKTVQRHKKAAEVQEELTNEPPKKFSHSTRRNRRRVDKALLETPEDELDHQNMRLKDLILLAEHKERLANKEAAKLKTPFTNQSSGDYLPEDAPYNEEDFASGQGKDCSDGEEIRVQEASDYFNYHSYMDKVPKSRWSKQDTELFYEGVRQFGADISMIQQLFPNRTRRQVLLKYKKEERQHPSRLDDALRNRAKDHSHFEKVIERLQQAAAQAKVNSNIDDSFDMTNEEVEEVEVEAAEAVSPKTKGQHDSMQQKQEVGKPEQSEGVVDKDEVVEDGAQSPAKSHDSEDDFFRWTQYKSDI